MTKANAVRLFRETELPWVRWHHEYDGKIDNPARREAWSSFIDALSKNNAITDRQCATWKNPF